MKKIVVAMSGGVDSSVSAYLLSKSGYDIVGITLVMGRCCDKQSVEDAAKVANQIGIKYDTLDVSEDFKKDIMNYFLESYKSGETPNPCARCNRIIKFKKILDYMYDIGADYMATGHYARIINNSKNEYNLCKAKNLEKDQSYFLSTIKYDYLKFIKFPLGNFKSKAETRKIARQNNIIVANKNDSQDVCFIDSNCGDYLEKNINNSLVGFIKNLKGEILGKHEGIFKYTIGQRRGLGISYKEPLFVVKLDSLSNTVYVGSNEDLYSDRVYLNNFNKLSKFEIGKEYIIKLRSAHAGQPGFIELIDEKNVIIKLKNPARAITKGQLCCIYDNDIVVGSGWII